MRTEAEVRKLRDDLRYNLEWGERYEAANPNPHARVGMAATRAIADFLSWVLGEESPEGRHMIGWAQDLAERHRAGEP